ncbi:MAG: NDP-sugar synthase [Actinomycetota bacterium]|nr:NDP-sugar synthase [Actinomycetota bacterium]
MTYWRGLLATLALMPVSDTTQFGVVRLDGEGNIVAFQEKPDPAEAISNLANTGIYVLEPEVLRYVPEGAFFDFANDLSPRLLQAREGFVGYEGDFYWSDVGTLEAYKAAQADALSGKVQVKIPGEHLGANLWVCEGAQLHATAALEGSVVLGRNAVVGRGADLSGGVTVGSDCWVHPGANVKNSILLPGSCVGNGARLEGCIVGPSHAVRPGERIRGATLSRGFGAAAARRRAVAGRRLPKDPNVRSGERSLGATLFRTARRSGPLKSPA